MKSVKTKDKLKRAGFIVSFTILPTLTFLIFYVYVNLNSFAMAFQYNAADGSISWTLDNIREVFRRLFPPDAEMGEAFANTFKTFGVNMVMFFIGIFVSFFLYNSISPRGFSVNLYEKHVFVS